MKTGKIINQGSESIVPTVITGTYSATTNDGVITCNSASAFALNLPAATGSGFLLTVANINTGLVTITPNGTDKIDGQATQIIAQWESVQLHDYASGQWEVL